jgi:hypothetical protein
MTSTASDSLLQTAFSLSGMVDPTFLVVQAAGGKDTGMLEGLMQVEGENYASLHHAFCMRVTWRVGKHLHHLRDSSYFTSGFTSSGVPVTAFVIIEDGGARSGGSAGDSRSTSQCGSGASTPSRGLFAGSKHGSGASTPTRSLYASTLDQMGQMMTPSPLSQVVVHGSGGESQRSHDSGGSSARSSVDVAAEAARAVLVERMMQYVKKNSLST